MDMMEKTTTQIKCGLSVYDTERKIMAGNVLNVA